MKIRELMIGLCLLAIASVAQALPLSITGTVTSSPGGGVFATQDWANGGFSLEVTVNQFLNGAGDADDTWSYTYHSLVNEKDISHFIIGVSESFTAANILTGTTAGFELALFGNEGGSNPGIPGTIYGIKLPGFDTDDTFTIVSNRGPKNVDFYMVDGKKPGEEVYAHNTNFGGVAPVWTYGSQASFGFILGPDTFEGGGGGGQSVPEPTTFALMALGLCGVVMPSFRRRKSA